MVSITKVVFNDFIKTLLLNLLSLESVEVQTSQSQQIMGTPVLVPVPKKVKLNGVLFTDNLVELTINLMQMIR